jgi:hypothetical protein
MKVSVKKIIIVFLSLSSGSSFAETLQSPEIYLEVYLNSDTNISIDLSNSFVRKIRRRVEQRGYAITNDETARCKLMVVANWDQGEGQTAFSRFFSTTSFSLARLSVNGIDHELRRAIDTLFVRARISSQNKTVNFVRKLLNQFRCEIDSK